MEIKIADVVAAGAYSRADLEAMRDWLKDCGEWANMEQSDFDKVLDAQLPRAIQRYYFGGLSQFFKGGEVR